MNPMNSLLAFMLASYIVPIAYVYYKYAESNKEPSSTPRSISSIITSTEPLFTIHDSIMLGWAASVFQTRHFIAACMFVMAVFTVLYEHQRCVMYMNSSWWSLFAIVVLLLGIFGVIYVPETNPVHYIFAAAAFFAIIGFMTWHTYYESISDDLRILLYAQILFMIITVIGVLQDAPIFATEVMFLMNFAVFYVYLHFNCFSPFFTVKN
jgi:hypothetical protein